MCCLRVLDNFPTTERYCIDIVGLDNCKLPIIDKIGTFTNRIRDAVPNAIHDVGVRLILTYWIVLKRLISL